MYHVFKSNQMLFTKQNLRYSSGLIHWHWQSYDFLSAREVTLKTKGNIVYRTAQQITTSMHNP